MVRTPRDVYDGAYGKGVDRRVAREAEAIPKASVDV